MTANLCILCCCIQTNRLSRCASTLNDSKLVHLVPLHSDKQTQQDGIHNVLTTTKLSSNASTLCDIKSMHLVLLHSITQTQQECMNDGITMTTKQRMWHCCTQPHQSSLNASISHHNGNKAAHLALLHTATPTQQNCNRQHCTTANLSLAKASRGELATLQQEQKPHPGWRQLIAPVRT